MLPNFIIGGAPKAGTTSLYKYLSVHPEIFMSSPKEVNYFSNNEIKAQGLYYNSFMVKELAEYQKLFDKVINEKAIGEASVSYLFYPKTPQKIKKIIPDVKIIIILRNPLERGYSHYLMDYKLGLVKLPYDQIVYRKSNHKYIDLYYQQYVELGLYYEQVRRYIDIFGETNVKIILNEDMNKDTKSVVKEILEYLGVSSTDIQDVSMRHNIYKKPRNIILHKIFILQKLRAYLSNVLPVYIKNIILKIILVETKKPDLAISTKKYLQNIYINDICKLEKLIDKDLNSWK